MPPIFKIHKTEIGLSQIPSPNTPIVIQGTLFHPTQANQLALGPLPIKDSQGNSLTLPPQTIITNIFVKSSSDSIPAASGVPLNGKIYI